MHAPGQQIGQARLVLDLEQLVLPGVAQIAVDEQRALLGLGKGDGEVGSQQAAALAAAGAHHGHGDARGSLFETTQLKLAAQRPQAFTLCTERAVGDHHLIADRVTRAAEIRVVELHRQGIEDVGLGEDAELHGGIAEAQVVLFLEVDDALDICKRQTPRVHQNRTDRPARFLGLS